METDAPAAISVENLLKALQHMQAGKPEFAESCLLNEQCMDTSIADPGHVMDFRRILRIVVDTAERIKQANLRPAA